MSGSACLCVCMYVRELHQLLVSIGLSKARMSGSARLQLIMLRLWLSVFVVNYRFLLFNYRCWKCLGVLVGKTTCFYRFLACLGVAVGMSGSGNENVWECDFDVKRFRLWLSVWNVTIGLLLWLSVWVATIGLSCDYRFLLFNYRCWKCLGVLVGKTTCFYRFLACLGVAVGMSGSAAWMSGSVIWMSGSAIWDVWECNLNVWECKCEMCELWSSIMDTVLLVSPCLEIGLEWGTCEVVWVYAYLPSVWKAWARMCRGT